MKNLLVFIIIFVTAQSFANKKFQSVSVTQKAGTFVFIGEDKIKLYDKGTNIKVGSKIADFVDKITEKDLFKGKVTLLNIVPSIDTPVCEEQTHILGEDKSLNSKVQKITLSRDLPMAQKRFAKEAKLTNITYLSDFMDSDFGKKSGLLMTSEGLLARAVMVIDQEGVVKHLQIVPNVVNLPDMKEAINLANKLVK